jgi:uncharacterized SAM-binding protein YcdF (DUF218 family)
LTASVVALLVIGARDLAPVVRRRWMLLPLALAALALAAAPSGFAPHKWLGRLLMPAALVWLALLLLSYRALRERRRGARLLCALFVGYWVLGNNWLSVWCASWLESPYWEPPVEGNYDAVAVLGGGTGYRPWGEAQLSLGGDRMATVAELYHAGRTRRILCAGPVVRDENGMRNGAADMMHVLEELGVPEEALVPIIGPTNTGEEIAAIAELVRARGWQRVGIVTSASHMRRAMRHAGRVGLAADALPADFLGGRIVWTIDEVLPSGIAFYRMQVIGWEVLGLLAGR